MSHLIWAENFEFCTTLSEEHENLIKFFVCFFLFFPTLQALNTILIGDLNAHQKLFYNHNKSHNDNSF